MTSYPILDSIAICPDRSYQSDLLNTAIDREWISEKETADLEPYSQ
ncbi:MAG: hypothetical protein WBB29_17490 [Geitlerinemataceae cyanobacterium]